MDQSPKSTATVSTSTTKVPAAQDAALGIRVRIRGVHVTTLLPLISEFNTWVQGILDSDEHFIVEYSIVELHDPALFIEAGLTEKKE